jgi:hypothetical protein
MMVQGQTAYQETLFVKMQHLKWFDSDLAHTIEIEYLRIEPNLRQGVQRLIREIEPDFVKGDDQNDREFYIAWDGIDTIERLRDLRSANLAACCYISEFLSRIHNHVYVYWKLYSDIQSRVGWWAPIMERHGHQDN